MRLPRRSLRSLVAAAKYAPEVDALGELDGTVSEVPAPWLVRPASRYADLPPLLPKNHPRRRAVRRALRARMEILGQVDQDLPWEECPAALRHIDEIFPYGMSFAEIGTVLGTRKQQVFKIYLRALAKLRAALGDDVELFLEALRAEPPPPSAWDAMYQAA